jgi:hypothetical protein
MHILLLSFLVLVYIDPAPDDVPPDVEVLALNASTLLANSMNAIS